MAAPSGKVPILASARAALDFVATQWRAIVPLALGGIGGALLVGLLAAAAPPNPGIGLLLLILQGAVLAFVYAGYLGVALKSPQERRGAILSDGGRLLTAMAVVAFFLFIVMIVALIPGGIIMGVALEPYQAELEAAQTDPQAATALLQRAFADNPWPMLLTAAIYVVIWLALTSRLYLVAPATIADGRVRTLETWQWTGGAVLRIALSRLVLLAPASVVLLMAQSAMLQWLTQTPTASPVLAQLFLLVYLFAALMVLALEAGLSAFLYRGLRPAAP